MRYFVFYNCGSCHDGSHSCGLAGFDTLDQARAHVSKLKEILGGEDQEFVIIEGKERV